ncbi:MAG: MerR family transcriptional regulator [Actinomycetota bacterium]|nr:MerR family transcriptional regulator [Actinomycetota bacterium]MDQ2955921.1 MerR family transcriptional regulator [Actinomycetota bacterium]
MTTTGTAAPDGDAPSVPIAEVSRLLGIPMPTLRSWELRYDMPKRIREVGTHRRYTPAELHGLRLMRDEIARGKQANVAAESVRVLLGRTGPSAEFLTQLLDASGRSDPIAVREQLDRAQAALGLAACLDDVLLPAMQQVGLWWQTGRCNVEQEQLTTEVARGWLETLTSYAPSPIHPCPIVLACGPTDLHTIGLEGLGILLRYQGWPCRLLGARTAVPALAAAIQASSAAGVVVVSHLKTGRQRAIQSLLAAQTLGVRVFYAGNAFNSPRSRRGVPGGYLGTNLGVACGLINTALIADPITPLESAS